MLMVEEDIREKHVQGDGDLYTSDANGSGRKETKRKKRREGLYTHHTSTLR